MSTWAADELASGAVRIAATEGNLAGLRQALTNPRRVLLHVEGQDGQVTEIGLLDSPGVWLELAQTYVADEVNDPPTWQQWSWIVTGRYGEAPVEEPTE